ncbi:MAG: hypothetical protein JST59_00505 [Actinobacteria bacterium]|nr:hypothetical protein [Actinomycetota bacterium]
MCIFQTNFQEYYSLRTFTVYPEDIRNIQAKLQAAYHAKLNRHEVMELEAVLPSRVTIKCHNPRCLFEFSYSEAAADQYALLNSFSMHLNECEMESEELQFYEVSIGLA